MVHDTKTHFKYVNTSLSYKTIFWEWGDSVKYNDGVTIVKAKLII